MWCRRVGGGADSALGVARQAVLFPPSLEAQNLPRPARHQNKKFTTLRVDGHTINLPKEVDEILKPLCERHNQTPRKMLALLMQKGYLSEDELLPIGRLIFKAKGSN